MNDDFMDMGAGIETMNMDPSLYADTGMTTPVDPATAGAAMAIFAGMMLFFFIFMAITYVYMGITLMKIAKKTNTPNAWLAWIPIANAVLMLQIAKRPMWWIILMFIPLVNIVIGIMVWMDLAEAVKKERWWGILIIVPVVGIIVPGYLAFSEMEGESGAGEQKPKAKENSDVGSGDGDME